jgi:hypothetical protein
VRIADALLALNQDVGESGCAGRLSAFGLDRCAPIDDSAYAQERRALSDLGQLTT